MIEDCRVAITLTANQVSEVMQHACVRTEIGRISEEITDQQSLQDAVTPLLGDVTLSRSTLRALLVLEAFGRLDASREITEVARELGISASTIHRYVRTWLALGLLGQDPVSRRYRRIDRVYRLAADDQSANRP